MILPGTRGHIVVSRQRLNNTSPLPAEFGLRDARLAFIATLIVVFGVLLLIFGLAATHPTEYAQVGARLIPQRERSQWFFEFSRDMGITFIGVGLVGVVYEIFNRRAAEAATARLFTDNADRLVSMAKLRTPLVAN